MQVCTCRRAVAPRGETKGVCKLEKDWKRKGWHVAVSTEQCGEAGDVGRGDRRRADRMTVADSAVC